jgi:hypothetical protein
MLNSDEQLEIGMEVIQQLRAEMALPLPLPVSPSIAAMNSAPAERRPSSRAALPSLAGLIRKIGPQPPYSALVGLCEDGLPFLLDLSDPVPGAILIAGDPGSGKTRLLQSLLASVGVFSGPEELCYTLITSRSQENALLQDQPHCLGILAPGERPAVELVLAYAEVANQRRTGRENGPVTILAIDDLAALDRQMDDKSTRYLQWLLLTGPQVGVWTIATLDAGQARALDRRLLPAFATRLIGKIASPEAASLLAGYPDPLVAALEGGDQFCVLYGNEWIRFWIPEIE